MSKTVTIICIAHFMAAPLLADDHTSKARSRDEGQGGHPKSSSETLREHLHPIRQYADALGKYCSSVPSSKFLAKFLYGFLSQFEKGLTGSSDYQTDELELSKLRGGLVAYFSEKDRLHGGYSYSYSYYDKKLLSEVSKLFSRLGIEVSEDPSVRFEAPLKEALRTLRLEDKTYCTNGKGGVDQPPPVVELEGLKVNGKGIPPDRTFRVEKGENLHIVFPASDADVGMHEGFHGWLTLNRRGAIVGDLSIGGTYANGKLLFDLEPRNYGFPPVLEFQSLSNVNDSMGNKFEGSFTSPIRIEIGKVIPISDNKTPRVDLKNIDIDGAKRISHNHFAVEAGKKSRISIPILDGPSDYATVALDFRDALGKREGQFFGSYSVDKGRAEFTHSPSNPYRHETLFIEKISGLMDSRGERVDIKFSEPIIIDSVPRVVDNSPPTVDFDMIHFSPSVRRVGEVLRVDAGNYLSVYVPVEDDISGVSPFPSVHLALLDSNGRDAYRASSKYDPVLGSITFEYHIPHYAKPRELSLGQMSDLVDLAQNSGLAKPKMPIRIEVHNANPDLKGPEVDVSGIRFTESGATPGYKEIKGLKTGQRFYIAIPARDDGSGVDEQSYVSIGVRDPKGRHYLFWGQYQKRDVYNPTDTTEEGRLLIDVSISPFALGGTYQITEISGVKDRAGNTIEINLNDPIRFSLESPLEDTGSPLVRLDRAKLEGHKMGKEKGLAVFESGQTLRLTLPLEDDISGFDDEVRHRIWIRCEGSDRDFKIEGRHYRKLGLSIFDIPLHPNIRSGKYKISSAQNILDRAGNSSAWIGEVEYMVRSTHEDTSPPTVDTSKIVYLVDGKPVEPGEFKAGTKFTVAIPVRDDLSGVNDDYYQPNLYIRDPKNGGLGFSGRYDKLAGTYFFEVSGNLVPGTYMIDGVAGIIDAVGNSTTFYASESIKFKIIPCGLLGCPTS